MKTGMPGDLVLIENGEHGGLNWAISIAQRKLLLGLGCKKNSSIAASRFTHSVMKIDDEWFGEMYAPHARRRKWSDLPKGTLVFVVRINGETHEQRQAIVEACLDDIEAKTPYPYFELLGYLADAIFHRPWWSRIFDSMRSDVCSGRYVHWAHSAGLMEGEMERDWFPARMYLDTRWFFMVGSEVV